MSFLFDGRTRLVSVPAAAMKYRILSCAALALLACRPSEERVNDSRIANAAQAVATAPVVLRFLANGGLEREQALQPGRALRIDYPTERLTACRSTHNGHPAWDLEAHVLFQPSGEERFASIRRFESQQGTPTNTVFAVPFETQIPAGTTSLEVWFVNWSGADSRCRAYDSNLGANYVFAVQRPVAWFGVPTVLLSRSTEVPCGTTSLEGGFRFDTWVRQRAAIRNLCFEVWEPGLTDTDRSDVWEQIDAQLLYRYADTEAWQSIAAQHLGRRGNNALYAVNLTALDPFRANRCTVEPTHPSENGQYVVADVALKISVNGEALNSQNGDAFVGQFEDYTARPCVP